MTFREELIEAGARVLLNGRVANGPALDEAERIAAEILDAMLAHRSTVECPECGGRGELFYGTWPTGDDDHDVERCEHCAGDGRAPGQTRLVLLAPDLPDDDAEAFAYAETHYDDPIKTVRVAPDLPEGTPEP